MSTKKPMGRKPRTKKEGEDDSPKQEQQQTIEINKWADEPKIEIEEVTEEPKSVLNFDRNEVAKLETKVVSELSVPELLKILIRRSEDEKTLNPIVSGDCERLLQKMYREKINSKPPFRNNNNFRGRGRFNRYPPRNQFARAQEAPKQEANN